MSGGCISRRAGPRELALPDSFIGGAITGYDGGYDGFLAGLLGCLPRCLYSLWVMNGMTQHQIKINGPDSDILVRRTMDDRGRRGGGVEQRHTAGDTYCEGVVYHFILIGRRASVGCS